MHISNWVPMRTQPARGRLPKPWIAEPISRRERLSQPARLAAQSFLILALIVAATFALLIVLDYAGIHITPTEEMLAAS